MKLFLAYHYPCLDGAYSAAMSFLFFREFKKKGYNLNDFIEYIQKIHSIEEISAVFKNDKTENNNKDNTCASQHEEIKQNEVDDEYMPFVYPELIYFPVKLNPLGKLKLPLKEFGEQEIKESVLILMDYYGQNIENITELCSQFKKMIILDHHLTFELILQEMKQNQAQPPNLLPWCDKSKSGVTVTFHFFESLLGKPLLKDPASYSKLCQVIELVEDHDIKRGTTPNAEEYAAAIFKRKMNFDLNTNTKLFRELLDVNIKVLIDIGIKELQIRIEKAKKCTDDKVKVYLGGKNETGEAKFGICYGVEADNPDLRNEVCEELAKLSINDGFENMGLLYSFDNHTKGIKISIRSLKNQPGGDCQRVAREFNGGGHYNASGFFMEKHELKKWL